MELLPAGAALWFLSTYATFSDWYVYGNDIVQRVFMAVLGAFEPRRFAFFKGGPIIRAYDLKRINLSASATPSMDWFYEADVDAFYDADSADRTQKIHTLPYLSLEIVSRSDGKVMYDLTDFIERIRVYSDAARYPSIGHILEVWGIHSCVIVNPESVAVIQGIDSNGDSFTIAYEAAVHGMGTIAPIEETSEETSEETPEETSEETPETATEEVTEETSEAATEEDATESMTPRPDCVSST